MRASRVPGAFAAPRRVVLILVTSALTLSAGLMPAGVGALTATSLPPPASMAAVGDSITQAASTGGSLGADAPQNSWSTGTSSTVNSHFLRLRQLNPSIVAHNLSVSGAKVASLNAQMEAVAALSPDPGYLTVLIGGNDLCTDTVAGMTSVTEFSTQFTAAMQTITNDSPGTYVHVVSIPDVWQLWNLFKGSFWARFIWSTADICQSLLANPTSTQTADQQRRATVRERNIDYNLAMEAICESPAFSARCHFDDHAVFGTQLTRSDVSGDYFHPSVAGQARLASVSWDAGFTWGSSEPDPPANAPPTASFSHECTELSCTFDSSGSFDSDGSIESYAWTFGDGGTSGATSPSHAYGAGGTYTVTLTVTDDDDAIATATGSVTVTAPPDAAIELTVRAYKVKGQQKADLSWTGATTTSVVVHRNDVPIITTPNDGFHTDPINARGGGTYRYRVCETGGGQCSPEVTASY